MKSIIPFLMFDGTAEEAVNFYVSTFGDAKIIHTAYYGNEVPEHEWKAMHIVFTIKNQVYMALNSKLWWWGWTWSSVQDNGRRW